MSARRLQRHIVLTLALFAGSATLLNAQQKPVSGHSPVVDVVSLKSGRSLRGAITAQQPNGSLTIVVSNEWLHSTNPALAATALKENAESRKAGWIQTRDRILERLKAPVDSPHLTFFLKQELERIEQQIADPNPPDPDFLWIDVRHETISKVARVSPERQHLAAIAWSERLAHVETRDVASLQKELTNRGVNLESVPDLSDRLPSRMQTEEEWGARLAVVEYSLGTSLDFQGMGDTLARVRDGKPVALGEILPKLLQQQLNTLLADLAPDLRPPTQPKGNSDWLNSATRIAEQEKVRGFRVTRLELDATALKVTVETRFVAQIGDGKWKTVWLSKVAEDGAKARPQQEARIEQDPQLKSVIEATRSLGLADADALKRAIRIGAATMSAQQTSDSTFAGFRERYTRHLDGPPLTLVNAP